MPRNFFKRIEVMFPILDEKIQNKIFKIIEIILKDNVKARILGSDGIYRKLSPAEGEIPIDSQMELCKDIALLERNHAVKIHINPYFILFCGYAKLCGRLR